MRPFSLLQSRKVLLGLGALLLTSGLTRVVIRAQARAATGSSDADLLTPEERRHLRNIRQLTFGGENAEAYFSADDRQLIFQGNSQEGQCDQIYTMNVDGSNKRMVSTG